MSSPAKDFLLMRFVPSGPDGGLLVLRLLIGLNLFLKHGWEKPTTFAAMAVNFPDPIHIGPVPSLVFALISDAICSVLVMLGLGTRWAALYIIVNVSTAWALVHHFVFYGVPYGLGDHGELCTLYISAFLAIFVAGPGRYSLDAIIAKGADAPVKPVTVS